MSIRTRSSTSPSPKVIAEASAWFIELRTADATAGDRERLCEWLRQSPEHIQAYLEIAEGWAALPTHDPAGRLDIQALIQRARESHDENIVALDRQPTMRPPRPAPMRRRMALAAGIGSIAVLATWFLYTEANIYRTGIGEQRMVRLEDGSIIELNALSKIRVRLSDKQRRVELRQGQALFHVAKDPGRPFTVHSETTTVRAVGTQFDVYKRSTGTVVTVLEGRVAVAEADRAPRMADANTAHSAPLLLAAGEQVTIPAAHSGSTDGIKPKRVDVTAATAWVQKQLIFNETPLADVAEEFNRHSTRRLVISDPELRALGVSGVYSSTQPEALLGFLRAQPNLRLQETDDEIRISFGKK